MFGLHCPAPPVSGRGLFAATLRAERGPGVKPTARAHVGWLAASRGSADVKLHRQHVDMADRLLAPALGDGRAHGAPHRLGHDFRDRGGAVSAARRKSPRPPHSAISAMDSPDASLSGMPISSSSGSAASTPLSSTANATETMPEKPSRRRAGDRARRCIDEERAVLVQAARGQLVDDFRSLRAETDEIAVAAHQHVRHPGAAGELGVLGKVQGFAVRPESRSSA